jgi:hypothetical protein
MSKPPWRAPLLIAHCMLPACSEPEVDRGTFTSMEAIKNRLLQLRLFADMPRQPFEETANAYLPMQLPSGHYLDYSKLAFLTQPPSGGPAAN